MINKIEFKNYKAFEENQNVNIRPLTIFLGKNSAGKSSVLRLPMLLTDALHASHEKNPFDLHLSGIDFGKSFLDLIYNRIGTRMVHFQMDLMCGLVNCNIDVNIQYIQEEDLQYISDLSITIGEKSITLASDLDEIGTGFYSVLLNGSKYSRCKIVFKGLLPKSIDIDDISRDDREKVHAELNELIDLVPNLSNKLKYIGPIRSSPKRIYRAGYVKSRKDFSGEVAPQVLYENQGLLDSVSNWYDKILNVGKVDTISIDDDRRYFRLVLNTKNSGANQVDFTDVGLGVSQSLPVVVGAINLNDDEILLVEQPELHLHPSAHGDIAELLMSCLESESSSKRIVVETHSENFILRIRRLVAEGRIRPESIGLYFVGNESDSTTIEEIQLNEKGGVSHWPEGIFEESFEEVKALRRAQKK